MRMLELNDGSCPEMQPKNRETMFTLWIKRTLAWDGILPAVIFLVPNAVNLIAPNNSAMIVFLAVALPITALLIRMVIGLRAIDSNNCSQLVRKFQRFVFTVGIFWLVLVESFVISIQGIPLEAQDMLVVAALLLIYFGLMATAMYPGRVRTSTDSTTLPELLVTNPFKEHF